MAKKSITKSKSALKPILKKYQSAGFNSSTYNQVTNPYYVSGTYAEQAGQEADRYYNQAGMFGDYASESNDRARQASAEREQAKKDAIAEIELQKKQEVQGLQQGALNALGSEGVAASKEFFTEKAAKKAAKKATEEAAKNAATTAGTAATAAVTPATNALSQGIAPTITAQAARGSGMEAARVATNMLDDTGAVVLPGQAASTAGGEVAKTAATTAASTAAKTGLLGNMSGLASAGIGLGLTGAGMLVQRKMDTDPTKFDRKEGRQNVFGDALKSAGSGFSMGATAGSVIPGLGNVAGGLIGGLAGAAVGVAKGLKENKESKKYAEEYAAEEAKLAAEEKKRKELLDKQASEIAQNYNTAFLGSRLTGLQTGFGYNTSTNMNMQPTSSFYGKTGGKLPGGHVVPIGDDAVKFIGRKHSEGGIKLDAKTEVEGGETMDKVMMNGGKPNDYFFSAYLKLGGKSFAKRHEELVAAGASQKEIQDLAKKQEAVANKKGEKHRGPEQIAKYGGIHKYQTAGQLVAGPTGKPVYKPADAMTADEYQTWLNTEGDSERAVAPNLPWVKDSGELESDAGNPVATYDFGTKPNKFKTNGPYKGSVAPQRTPSRRPGPDSTAAEPVDSKGARTPEQSANAQSNKNAKNVTVRDQNKANAKAPSNQQSVASGSKGGTNSAGQNAANTAAATKSKFDQNLFRPAVGSAIASANEWTKFVGLPEGKSALAKEDEGGTSMSMKGVPAGQRAGKKFYGNVTDLQYAAMVSANPWYDFTNFDPSNKDQVLNFQKEYNKRVKAGEKLKEDGKFGQQTATSRLYKDAPAKAAVTPEAETPVTDQSNAVEGETKKEDTTEAGTGEVADIRKGINGSILAGLGQLIPVGYALARPYKAEGNLPRMQGAGNVGSTSVRGAVLPRVNMNAERAAAERNTVALRNAVQNTNAGPGGIAAMMAANSAQGTQMLDIANQEQRANRELAAEEARLGMQASMSNAEMAQRASIANVQNRLAVNQANLEAGMQEARMKIDEKRYKREEILGALDTAASRIAGIVKDEKSYKAQERLAKAIDNTGSYDRFTIYEQLQKESEKKGSPYYGKTDQELRKIASDTFNEVLGKLGTEGEGTAKLGGARRYTSRLGDLNRGRNKRNFNI